MTILIPREKSIEEHVFIFNTMDDKKIKKDIEKLRSNYRGTFWFFGSELAHFYDKKNKTILQLNLDGKVVYGEQSLVIVSRINQDLGQLNYYLLDKLNITSYSWSNFLKFMKFPDKRSRVQFDNIIYKEI